MTTALVTGAGVGLGAAFARELARTRHDLVVVSRTRADLEKIATELRGTYGVDVEVIVADLTDRTDLQRVADRVGSAQHPVDLLVNNAGFGLSGAFLDTDVADQERMLDVLCRATLVLSHAAAEAMSARGRGAIVNVSSVAGFAAMGTYSAAKAWQTTFSESLAEELRPHGVSVTAVCPGFTHTQFHERAGLDMSRLPSALWLEADDVVRQGLADARRGRAVSVPGAAYQVITAATRLVPRSLVRSISRELATRRGQ